MAYAASNEFSGDITGTGNLTIANNATQILSGNNHYTGTTTIASTATLALAGTGAIANSSLLTVNGIFDVTNASTDTTVAAITGNTTGVIKLSTHNLILTAPAAPTTRFSGLVIGDPALIINGNATFADVSTSFNGTTTISPNATFVLTGDGSLLSNDTMVVHGAIDCSNSTTANILVLGVTGSGSINLGDKTLALTNANGTLTGAIGGTGDVAVLSGTQTFAGDNAYTGTTTIGDNATLNLAATGTITDSRVITNGTLNIAADKSIVSLGGHGHVDLGNNTLTLSDATDEFAGTISNAPAGSLVIASGTQTLSNINTYTGTTTIAPQAILLLTGLGAIANSSAIYNHGTLDVTGSTYQILNFDGSYNQATTGNLNIASTNNALQQLNFNGAAMLAGNLTVTDLKTKQDLSAASNGLKYTLLSFTKQISGSFTNFFTNIAKALNPTLSYDSNHVYLNLKYYPASYNNTLINPSSDPTNNNNNRNTANNSLVIAYGEYVKLHSSHPLKTQPIISHGTLDLTHAHRPKVAATSLAGNGRVVLGAKTLKLTKAKSNFAGVISGAGGLTIKSGSETLSGHNTYRGLTKINHGATLNLAATGKINHSAVTANGNFNLHASSAIKSLAGSGSVNLGHHHALTLTQATGDFSGTISGAHGSGLIITSGTETLLGKNTYTGNTVIKRAATLRLAQHSTIAKSQAIYNDGNFDLTSSSLATNKFAGSYTQSASGNLIITNTSAANKAFQALNFTGTASLGGKLTVKNLSAATYKIGEKYPLLTARTITQPFTQLSTDLDALLNPYLSYTANSVSLNLAPSHQLTYQSIQQNLSELSMTINAQSAAMQSGLAYHCDRFDQHGICISVGSRYTHVHTDAVNKERTGTIIVGYKPRANLSFGGFVDQSFDATVATRINRYDTQPMWGLFGNWSLDQSGHGLNIQAATAFANYKLAIGRTGTVYSEAGIGNTRMTGHGYQMQANYIKPVTSKIKLTPYLGWRYTQIHHAAYTENQASAVAYPLSYHTTAQNIFAILAGLGVSGQLTQRLTGTVSLGMQQNLTYRMDDYAGTSTIPHLTNFALAMPRASNTLAAATAGIAYDMTHYGSLGLNLYWQQQAFVGTNTTTALATYTLKI